MLLAFDLDGTLVDSRQDIAASANAALEAVGLPRRPEAEVATFVGGGARNLVARCVEPHADRLEETLAAWHDHYAAHLLDSTLPFPGVVEMLQELAPRCRLAVATNKPGRYARAICDALFPGLFGQVIGGDEAPRKPDPAMLHAIVEKEGMPLAAYVGDMDIDERTAAAFGCAFVGVDWGFGAFTGKAYLVHSPPLTREQADQRRATRANGLALERPTGRSAVARSVAELHERLRGL